jgi:uncharacterized membrane-anchored protein
MGLVVYGCFMLLTGKMTVDAGTAATVAGLVGTVMGYVAANAQQVLGYFFGSSQGSAQKSDHLADSLATTIRQLGGAKA